MIWRFIVEHIVEMGSLGDFRFGRLGHVTGIFGTTDSFSTSEGIFSASGGKEVSARESNSCCLNSLSFGLLLMLP